MRRFLWLLILLGGQAACATTYYIRLDGGNNVRCTGTTNAPDPGSGSGQPCAFDNPLQMLDSGGNWAHFTGGDTMQFADPPTNSAGYYIGEQNNGVGMDWSGQISTCPSPNTDGNACFLPPIPSGTLGAHTKIIGQCVPNCHLSDHTGLVYGPTYPTILSGINNVFAVLVLQGASYVDISGILITQPDVCTKAGIASIPIDSTAAAGGTYTYLWHNSGFGNNPLLQQRVNVTGTTNGSGIFNITNQHIQAVTLSAYNITQSQITSSTTATLHYSLVSGEIPIVGQTGYSISGLIAASQVNTAAGFYNAGSITSSITNVTGSTFEITLSAPFWTTTSLSSESGTMTNSASGAFTVNGAGSVSPQTETGTMTAAGFCTQSNNFAQTGILFGYLNAQGPSNFTITDTAIVGMAFRGILGGHINTSSGDISSATDLYVIGSGYTGIDSDGGGCGTSCESLGTVNYDHIDVEWSGCVPTTHIPQRNANNFDLCYTQNSQGQGDGFVNIAAGDFTENVTNSYFRYNTQDGFDGLHLSDDITTNPVINLSTSWSEGNAGQAFKIGGGNSSTAISNVAIANCAVAIYGTFPGNPAGWNAGVNSVDVCRASGDQWTFQMKNGTLITFENNTTVGYGATMYEFDCAFLAPNCTSNGAHAVFRNNISKGYADPRNGVLAAGCFFDSNNSPPLSCATLFSNAGSVSEYNLWDTMRLNACPDPTVPSETNAVCADPLLASESDINAINPNLLSGSPARLAGTTPCPATDFNGNSQTSPCTIGAFVFISASSGSMQGKGRITMKGRITTK